MPKLFLYRTDANHLKNRVFSPLAASHPID
jgi:hypothetical protein